MSFLRSRNDIKKVRLLLIWFNEVPINQYKIFSRDKWDINYET